MSLFSALKAQPDAEHKITNPTVVDQMYRYWRFRILTTSLVGYAIFYFVRTNISMAIPVIENDLGITKTRLGVILTVGGVTYGVSKFVNGFLGDRANPRYFMAIGLLLSAIMNIFFGMSSSLLFLGIFWITNNWAQGMGFPPCARNMGYWFSPRERSSTFGIWHIGHMVGAATVSVLAAYILKIYGDWRMCFYIPAGIAMFSSVMIFIFLRDTPGSMGLPPVEIYRGEESAKELSEETGEELSYRELLVKNVFTNKFMWIISMANFLVYTMRYASLHWGPTYLQEMKNMTLLGSGWLHFGSEMAGLVGALMAGFLADYLFGGRAGRVCVIAMILMTGVLYLFKMSSSPYVVTVCFLLMSFLVYVPQMLIAAIAMNLGTKRAAAAAVGLTGIFGYASTVVSGMGIGWIAQHLGWDAAFVMLIGCAVATAFLMLLTWNVGAHPQLEHKDDLPA